MKRFCWHLAPPHLYYNMLYIIYCYIVLYYIVLKELILPFTKDVQFTYNNLMYKLVDGIAMASPLESILARIIMVKLERTLISTWNCHLNNWYSFVDDTFCFINHRCVNYVFSFRNSFHPHTQFPFELENLGKLSFLDVQLIHNAQQLGPRLGPRFTVKDPISKKHNPAKTIIPFA